MKYLVFLTLFLFTSFFYAQETTVINGKTYELKTAIEGELDLLWNVADKRFHYFIKTSDEHIIELSNTKNENGFQEEYKTQLIDLTEKKGSDTHNLKFTLQDLKAYIKTYNTSVGNSYSDVKNTLKLRLGLFGGITNQPFVTNPDNINVPFFGMELEGISSSTNSNHAGFFSIIQALDNDDFEYSSTQLALGYRYRFLNKSKFNIYGNMRLATYTFSKETFRYFGLPNETINKSTFQIPCSFGLGADIKLSNKSFITLAYNELFAIFISNNDNFPLDLAIGYKLSL
jgi:hypothetical protein